MTQDGLRRCVFGRLYYPQARCQQFVRRITRHLSIHRLWSLLVTFFGMAADRCLCLRVLQRDGGVRPCASPRKQLVKTIDDRLRVT